MKGLLVKDFRILAGQKRMWLVMIFLCIFFVLSGRSMNFVIGYLALITTFLAVTTITYDEYNNGYRFLFTMPVTRTGYAVEKYVLGLLLDAVICAVVAVVGAAVQQSRGFLSLSEWIATVVVVVLIAIAFLDVMIPLQLKFGAEKGRITIMIFFFATFGAVTILTESVGESNLAAVQQQLDKISTVGWAGIGLTAFAVLTVGSVLTSIHIMKKKQF